LRREKKKNEKTYLHVEEKRREGVEERRERKKKHIGVFYKRGREKKKRRVCYEMRDSDLLIGVFYRWFTDCNI
jgi:hypothetical protein